MLFLVDLFNCCYLFIVDEKFKEFIEYGVDLI